MLRHFCETFHSDVECFFETTEIHINYDHAADDDDDDDDGYIRNL